MLTGLQGLGRFPAIHLARRRVIELARSGGSAPELTEAIESDVALTVAVLREANVPAPGTVASVPAAVAALASERLAAVAQAVEEFDLLSERAPRPPLAERHRLHALPVRHVAVRVASLLDIAEADEIAAAALLHDVGKLKLERRDAVNRTSLDPGSATPQARLEVERGLFGDTHAEVGAALALDWGLPVRLAEAIASHHDGSARFGAVIQLADAIAHYASQHPIDVFELEATAVALGLARSDLSELLYEVTQPDVMLHPSRPCPLSQRELEVLRCLASGQVPKEIGQTLCLSTSTVRNHLHRIYSRLDVSHRTQAVVLAAAAGWI
jgi:putative nucleotidyltransferase with HDIG domain